LGEEKKRHGKVGGTQGAKTLKTQTENQDPWVRNGTCQGDALCNVGAEKQTQTTGRNVEHTRGGKTEM